jgi:hypothetical protein
MTQRRDRERTQRIERSLADTINIIERYRVKGDEWLRLSGEGEIMGRYEHHRDELLAMLRR